LPLAMRQLLGPAVAVVTFLVVMAYSIAYFVVAFSSDATVLWWWFVPVYGTIKIFGASILLGIFHVAIISVGPLAGFVIGWSEI
jgi:hypothetical protein